MQDEKNVTIINHVQVFYIQTPSKDKEAPTAFHHHKGLQLQSNIMNIEGMDEWMECLSCNGGGKVTEEATNSPTATRMNIQAKLTNHWATVAPYYPE